MDLEPVKRVAVAAAYKGARAIMPFYGRLSKINKKGAIDLVTEADTESEKIIIETIKTVFPDHSILAEESGLNHGNSESKWIIDPLDGTTNFTHQLGIFSVSIAFALNGNVVVGVVFNPAAGELFTAVKGNGAALNGRPITVSNKNKISESLLVTGFPYNHQKIFKTLSRSTIVQIGLIQSIRNQWKMVKPETVFKVGAVRASIFRNVIEKNGRSIPLPKVVIEVRYKDKTGQWQGTHSLSLNDLPKAILALQKAFAYLMEHKQSEREERSDMGSL